MNRLKIIRKTFKTSEVFWESKKVANLNYEPVAKFCYRIDWLNGQQNYGCSMEFVELFVGCVMSRETNT